ncbi:MAG: hypothetical protein IPL10_16515 [Bacteroidetes bacterium]|nr:hypothetical protein [Bacteroidota bacterium]
MSALAEISIILSNTDIRDRYQLDDNINELLSSMLFLIKDLNPESVKLVTEHINSLESRNGSNQSGIDYKSKYEQTLEKLNAANEELLNLKGVNVN